MIDLACVNFVCTACLAVLFLLDERVGSLRQSRDAAVAGSSNGADSLNIKVRVRVNRKVAGVCQMMGVDKVVTIEVA